MKFISHRGNYSTIYSHLENKPSYIDDTISLGYDVEVDIRYINKKFYLGHDTADTEISEDWILSRKERLWFHCKNLYAAQKFSEMNYDIKYFCHSSDSYVLTSTNHIWVHDLDLYLNDTCIIPLLDKTSIKNYKNINKVYAICTDYIDFAKKIINE